MTRPNGAPWRRAPRTSAQRETLEAQRFYERGALIAEMRSVLARIVVGKSPTFAAILSLAYIALAHLQLPEPAAILAGVTDAHFPPRHLDQEWQAHSTATERLILDALGAIRTQQLKAHGATLTIADAVAYLRNECDRALANHPSPTDDGPLRTKRATTHPIRVPTSLTPNETTSCCSRGVPFRIANLDSSDHSLVACPRSDP